MKTSQSLNITKITFTEMLQLNNETERNKKMKFKLRKTNSYMEFVSSIHGRWKTSFVYPRIKNIKLKY